MSTLKTDKCSDHNDKECDVFCLANNYYIHCGFLKGVLISGHKNGLTYTLRVGGQTIDTFNPLFFTFVNDWLDENGKSEHQIYYPLFQAGTLSIPLYHELSILCSPVDKVPKDLKIFFLTEWDLGNEMICDYNIMTNGRVASTQCGLNIMIF